MPNKSSNLSLYASLLIILSYLFLLSYGNFVNPISWDIFGYYLYLPANFIHQDLSLSDQSLIHSIYEKYQPSTSAYQIYIGPKGLWMIRYTYGFSLMAAPFFFLAHFFCVLFASNLADGFSLPYQLSLYWGSFFYVIVGLLLLRKILLSYFTDISVSITLLVFYLFTNLIFYCLPFITLPLLHVYEFTLILFLIFLTQKWHLQQSKLLSILLGIVLGLIIIMRPSNVVCCLIPLLWGISSKTTLNEKLKLLMSNKLNIALAFLFCFLVGLPQFLYWKYFAGSYLFDSYNNPAEGLDLDQPHLINLLFSFRKGWLLYTPLMIFSILGFYHLKNKKDLFLGFTTFSIINIYLISCWTVWWYACSFSQRSLVDSYAVWAFGFAAFTDNMLNRSKTIKYSFFTILIILCTYHGFTIFQAKNGLIDCERMTKEFYLETFLKTKVDADSEKKLLPNLFAYDSFEKENKSDFEKKQLLQINFKKELNSNQKIKTTDSLSIHGEKAGLINASVEFFPILKIAHRELTKNYYCWVRVTMQFYPTDTAIQKLPLMVMHSLHDEKTYNYQTISPLLNVRKLIPNEWQTIYFDCTTKELRNYEKDEFTIYLWNINKSGPLFIDNIIVESFTPKQKWTM